MLKYTQLRHRLLADTQARSKHVAHANRWYERTQFDSELFWRAGIDLTGPERRCMRQLRDAQLLRFEHVSGHYGHMVRLNEDGSGLLARWNAEHGDPKDWA